MEKARAVLYLVAIMLLALRVTPMSRGVVCFSTVACAFALYGSQSLIPVLGKRVFWSLAVSGGAMLCGRLALSAFDSGAQGPEVQALKTTLCWSVALVSALALLSSVVSFKRIGRCGGMTLVILISLASFFLVLFTPVSAIITAAVLFYSGVFDVTALQNASTNTLESLLLTVYNSFSNPDVAELVSGGDESVRTVFLAAMWLLRAFSAGICAAGLGTIQSGALREGESSPTGEAGTANGERGRAGKVGKGAKSGKGGVQRPGFAYILFCASYISLFLLAPSALYLFGSAVTPTPASLIITSAVFLLIIAMPVFDLLPRKAIYLLVFLLSGLLIFASFTFTANLESISLVFGTMFTLIVPEYLCVIGYALSCLFLVVTTLARYSPVQLGHSSALATLSLSASLFLLRYCAAREKAFRMLYRELRVEAKLDRGLALRSSPEFRDSVVECEGEEFLGVVEDESRVLNASAAAITARDENAPVDVNTASAPGEAGNDTVDLPGSGQGAATASQDRAGSVSHAFMALHALDVSFIVFAHCTAFLLTLWNYDPASIFLISLASVIRPTICDADGEAFRFSEHKGERADVRSVGAIAGCFATRGLSYSMDLFKGQLLQRFSYTAYSLILCRLLTDFAFYIILCISSPQLDLVTYWRYAVYDLVVTIVLGAASIVPLASITGKPRSLAEALQKLQRRKLLQVMTVLCVCLTFFSTNRAVAFLDAIFVISLVYSTPPTRPKAQGYIPISSPAFHVLDGQV